MLYLCNVDAISEASSDLEWAGRMADADAIDEEEDRLTYSEHQLWGGSSAGCSVYTYVQQLLHTQDSCDVTEALQLPPTAR